MWLCLLQAIRSKWKGEVTLSVDHWLQAININASHCECRKGGKI